MIQELLDNLPRDILLNMPHHKLNLYIRKKFREIGFVKTNTMEWNWNIINKRLIPDSIMFRQIFLKKSEMKYFISSNPNKAEYPYFISDLGSLVRIDMIWIEIVHSHLCDLPPPELIYENYMLSDITTNGRFKSQYKLLNNSGKKDSFYPSLYDKPLRLNYILIFKNHIINQEYWIEPNGYKKYKTIDLVESYKKIACQLAGEDECIFKKPTKKLKIETKSKSK